MFLNICIINYQEDNNELSVIWLSLYAVVFSMIITPEFGGKKGQIITCTFYDNKHYNIFKKYDTK